MRRARQSLPGIYATILSETSSRDVASGNGGESGRDITEVRVFTEQNHLFSALIMHRRPRRYCVNFWWHLLRQRWGITIYAGKFDGRGLEAATELPCRNSDSEVGSEILVLLMLECFRWYTPESCELNQIANPRPWVSIAKSEAASERSI